MLALAAVAYPALLACLLLLLEWKAESFWFLTVLLFAPPQIFVLPALGLAVPCVLFRQWRLCIPLGTTFLLVLLYMHPRLHGAPSHDRDPSELTLITHNIGQGNRQQFAGFLESEKPDIILLQDARGRSAEFQRRFPDFYVSARGQFVCLSRYLIQQGRELDSPNWHGQPVMAHYEISFHGKPIALYSVHFPTPRAQLSRFLGARTAIAMFGNEELPGGKATLHEWNTARVELYEAASKIFAAEPLPFLVAGDFNMPDHGELYHNFCSTITDTFATSGSGCGFTFPGGMGRVAGLLGPWLRIDYAFAGHGVQPIACHPESGILSQHRAVSMRFGPEAKHQ